MKVAIVEDEERAVNRLKQLLFEVDPTVEVIAEMETVREVVAYDWANSDVQLLFLDIHLADGSSFEIFKDVQLDLPVIFTTAYHQYALEAFQINSVDYLLKPVDVKKLRNAMEKWRKWHQNPEKIFQPQLQKLMESLAGKKAYSQNLLVAQKHKLIPVSVSEFAMFYIENSVVRGITFDQQTYFPEQNMDELEVMLDSSVFYRANRQMILNQKCITGIESFFNSRLLISTKPSIEEDIIISKAKAREFKNWLKGEKS